MYLLRFAYRNFFRNTRRSIISGLSIAIAIAVIIFAQSYIRGYTYSFSENIVRLISGHITITTKEYERRERLLPLSESMELTDSLFAQLQDDQILAVTPRIRFGVLLGEEELDVPALGYAIEPDVVAKFSVLPERIIEGAYLSADKNEVIIGKGLSERLGLGVGDTLIIITRTAYGSPTGAKLLIKGIFATNIGGVDRNFFYIPFSVGQRLLDLVGETTELIVYVKDGAKAIDLAQHLRKKLDLSVLPYQYNPILRYINSFKVAYSLFYLIILLVACSAIANTMLMVVFERTKEIGMMKALGMNNSSIIGLLICEAGIIAFIGSFVGSAIGAGISYWLRYHGIDFSMMAQSTSADLPFGPIIYFAPTPLIVVSSFILGVLLTIIVAFLPVIKVARITPAHALRTK